MFRAFIRRLTVVAWAVLPTVVALRAEIDAADLEAIKKPAVDYIQAWYDGDAGRMGRAVHEDLAKRIPRDDPATGRTRIDHMGASQLLQATRAGSGAKIPAGQRLMEIVILDAHENIAVVKVVSAEYVDYLHVARVDGRWLIVNVLWNRRDVARRGRPD